MKVVITHLGAPWPEGAGVGSVVQLPDGELPGWAVGKCKDADEEAEAEFAWEPVAPPSPVTVREAGPADPGEVAGLRALLEESRAESAELRNMLKAQDEKIAALAAQVAQAPKPKGRG